MKRSILLTLFLLLISAPLGMAREVSEHPNFTGNWTLNKNLSDDIHQVMMKAMGSENRRGGGGGNGSGGMGSRGRSGGRGGGRGGGMGGGMGGRPGSGQSGPNPQARKRSEEMKQQHSRLEIFQDGIELNITNGLDITHLLHTDGRTENIWTQRGQATATANWQAHTLVVRWETRQEAGGRTRTFQLNEAGTRMTVKEMIRVPGSKGMVSVQLVYDLD